MADIRLAKPAAGASQTVTCEPEARFVFDFPTSDATLAREGDNLNIRFEDGSQLQLQGFYQEYNGDNLPSFNIDGTEVAAADFFEAMNEPDLMPAAGPGTGTVANGARFHEWGDSSLAAGITHLNGLDWGFSRSFEWDDVPNAVGRNGDDWGLLYSRGEGGSVPGEPGSPVPGNTVPELTTPPAPEPPVDPDNPGDDPGKPVGPGNPGGYVPSANGASIVVDEGALAGGSGQHVLHGASGKGAFLADVHAERGGSIVLAHGGQSLTLAIPENDATVIGVPQGAAATFVNVNGVDITILGATSNGDGKWTVSYEYTLAGRVEHDKAAHDTVLFDDRGIAITVTDGTGDVTSGRLTVEVHDDVPQFSVESTGAATSLAGSFGLNFGADAAAATGALTAAGATSTTVEGATTHLTFAEGTLSVTNEGGNEFSYTFTPSAAYDNLEFSKDITLTATDGDQDTDTLVITVGQPKEPTITNTTPSGGEGELSAGDITADEGALPDGTRDHAEHDFKGNGSFTVDMHGENGTITVSDGVADGAHTATITLDGDHAVVTGDKLHVNGVDVEITGARLEGSEWTVTFKYTLTENVKHEGVNAPNGEDVTAGKLYITATDDDADSAPAHAVLNVFVHDDAPQFVGEATGSVTSREGSFELSFGADKAAEVDSLTAAGAEKTTVDGNTTTMEFTDGTLTITENDDKTYSYTFTPNATAGDNFEKHIELTATDADGDTDTFTIVVGNHKQPSFPGTNPLNVQVGEITTDEGALKVTDDEGKVLIQGTGEHDEHGVKGNQSFKVDMAGEDGTITVSDGEHITTITITGNRAEVTGDRLLHINGVDVEVTDAIRLSGNEWTVNYKYALTGTVEHGEAGASGEDDTASDTLTVTAAFAGEGTTAEAKLTINVHDDAPHFEGKATGDEASLKGGFELAFGADGKATEVDSLSAKDAEITVDGNKTVMEFTEGTLTITENADKSYSYTFEPNDTAGDNFEKHIELTATDSDGDTDTFTIVVGNYHQPSFPGTDPLDVALKVGEVTTDEGALASGTGAHDDHDITGPGSFTVDMHGEDGSITVSDGKHTTTITIEDGVAKVESEGTLHVNGVDMVIKGAELVDGQWQVNYTYTLTESVEHAEGAGKSGEDDTASDTLAVTAAFAGEGATPVHAVLTVHVHDDAPQFSVEEVGDKTSLEGEFGLNFGADAAAASFPLWAEGSESTRVVGDQTIMKFTEGTLTITSEGGNKYSYTFEPNDEYAGKEFSRDIELTAKDGDEDTDTLTIHVGTVKQPNFPGHTPSHGELKVGEIIADEGALPDGTGAHAEHPVSGPGSFTVDMHGEDGSITVADQAGHKVTITIEDGEAKVESNGTLHVNDVDVEIGYVVHDGTQWTVNYTYTLTERVEHAGGAGKSGEDDPAYGQLDVTATYTGEDAEATAVIKVTVHDDAPMFGMVTPDTDDTLKGEFGLKFGADTMADNFPLTAEYAIETSPELSNGEIFMVFPEGKLTITSGEGDTWSYTFEPNDTYKDLQFSRDITLTATDKDGDTDTTTITVGQEFPPTITTDKPGTGEDEPKVDGTKVIVDEAALSGGTGNGENGIGDGHDYKGSNAFSVNLHGEEGSIVIEVGDQSVTFNIAATTAANGEPVRPTGNAELEVNGVTLTFTKAELVDGKWEVHYDYKLDHNIKHDLAGPTGADDPKGNDSIKITVTDSDKHTDEANMTVTVHDDGPVLTAVTIDDVKTDASGSYLSDSVDKITGQLKDFAIGADKEGATVKISVSHDGVEDSTATFEVKDGKLVPTDKNSDLQLELGEDGTFTFTRPEGHYKDGNDHNDKYTFTATVTDSDGDHVEKSVTVSTNHTPDIKTPGGDPVGNDKEITGAEITVDEKYLTDGTSHDATKTVKEGTFTLDTHGEGGTVKFSLGTENMEFTLEKNTTTEPSKFIETAHGTFTIESIKDGVVTYKYELTTHDETPADDKAATHSGAEKITVELTDGVHNDPTSAYIAVNIVDDMPEITDMSYQALDSATVVRGEKLRFVFDDIQNVTTTAKDFVDHGIGMKYVSYNNLGATQDYSIKEYKGSTKTDANGTNAKDYDAYWLSHKGVEIIATYVKYEYSAEGQITVDLQDDVNFKWVPNPGSHTDLRKDVMSNKKFALTEEGLTVGSKAEGTVKYDGSTLKYDSDEISVINGYMSEALTFENSNQQISYGVEIEFGKLDPGETVLVGFYLTPTNSNDDSTVRLVQAVAGKDDGSYTWKGSTLCVNVPDGFTKIIVSAAPNKVGDTDTGFTIKSFQFLSHAQRYEGALDFTAGADGLHAENGVTWDWGQAGITNGGTETVKIFDAVKGWVPYTVKYTVTGDTVKAEVTNGDLQGALVFEGHLDKNTGKWEIDQNHKFTRADGKPATFDVTFTVKDSEGDSFTSDPYTIDMSNPVNLQRFDQVTYGSYNAKDEQKENGWGTNSEHDNAYDVLAGSELNDLIYGRGGNDILFGDGGDAAFGAMRDFIDNNIPGTYLPRNDTLGQGGAPSLNTAVYKQVIEGIENLGKNGDTELGTKLDALQAAVEKASGAQKGDDGLFGGVGDDILFGGAGNDYLSGNGKIPTDKDGKPLFTDHDILLGGSGNDIIVFDADDKIIHGGEDNDILLAGSTCKASLKQMLEHKADINAKVFSIEVLLKATNTTHVENLGITSHASLLLYGIVLGEKGMQLDMAVWEKVADTDGNLTYKNIANDGPGTLEIQTTLDPDHVQLVAKGDLGKWADEETTAPDAQSLVPADAEDADTDSGAQLFAMRRSAPADEDEGESGQSAAAPSAGGPAAEGRNLIEGDEDEPNMLFGTDGDDVIIGGSAADFIDGGAGSDTIYAGGGDDLIVYDPTDYLIDGGTGIDFLLAGSGEQAHTLADMLKNWEKQGEHDEKMPMVHDVEVMIKGVDTMGLQNMEALAAKFGFSMDKDANGRDVLILGDQWKEVEGSANGITTTYTNGAGVTLETTLQASGETDQGEQAAQAIVLTSNG